MNGTPAGHLGVNNSEDLGFLRTLNCVKARSQRSSESRTDVCKTTIPGSNPGGSSSTYEIVTRAAGHFQDTAPTDQRAAVALSMATTNDRDTKPENLIDHLGVDTGEPKPPAVLPWNPPGERRPPLRAGAARRSRRPR